MGIIKRRYWVLALVAVIALGAMGITMAFSRSSADVPPRHIDDGAELLPQASITLEQAIAAAQKAESGAVGEVDLEMYQGKLVFNVDIGDKDIKVNASNGDVLGLVQDDGDARLQDNNVREPSYTGSIMVDDTQYEGMSDAEQAAALQPLAKISAAEAEAAALAANPGNTALQVELDNENGTVVYSVELSNGLDVKVDAGTGKILHTEADEPDRQNESQEQQSAGD